MPEGLIVTQCAPTLARLKTGNLFNCEYDSKKNLYAQVNDINKRLFHKGVCMRVVGFPSKQKALIYVYRPEQLKKDFQDEGIRNILKEKGYDPDDINASLKELVKRLKNIKDFPHEIGCFLGYPSEDILGFIDKDRKYKYVGVWQVYGDVEKAIRLFDTYRRCTTSYLNHFAHGMSLESLALAE